MEKNSKKSIPPNRYLVQQRRNRIANCEQCKGTPATHECNLQGLVFNVCDECQEIVGDYKKEGEPIKIITRVERKRHMHEPGTTRTEITIKENIPGKSFTDFEII